MKNSRLVFLCAQLMWVSTVANAVSVDASSGVYLSYRDCVAGETACDELSAPKTMLVDGLPGSHQAAKQHDDPARGKVSGEVKLTESPLGSRHRASATSLPGRRNGSNTLVIQKYSNSSDVAENLTISGVLQFDQQIPVENAGLPAGKSSTFAEFVIMGANIDQFEAGSTAEDNLKILLEGPGDVEFSEKGFAGSGESPADSSSGSKSLTATTTVAPGESVWVWTITQALAANGAEVSADLEITFAVTKAE